MERLRMSIKKYYNAHQVSKSINILDLALMKKPSGDIRPLKCVCNFLQPRNGWDRKVTSTSAPEEQCFYCMSQLKDTFSDYERNARKILPPGPDNKQCQYCYWYCAHKYVTASCLMQLTKKFVKKGKNIK